jgi:crotonobetainyl-CoA:carnitine CoA-transferase CaiB-like acyl-CoA transferase
MVTPITHPTIGALKLVSPPLKFSDTPTMISLSPPLLGEHTDEILTEVLGYGRDRIEELRNREII